MLYIRDYTNIPRPSGRADRPDFAELRQQVVEVTTTAGRYNGLLLCESEADITLVTELHCRGRTALRTVRVAKRHIVSVAVTQPSL